MTTTLCLTLALLSAGAPVPKDVAPAGPAPFALPFIQGTDGVIRVIGISPGPAQEPGMVVGDSPLSPGLPSCELADLKGLTIYTVDGREVSLKDATKKLAAGAPAVASSDGKKVAPDKRKTLKPDTLIFVSPDLAKERPDGIPTHFPKVSYVEPLLPAISVGK